MTLFEEEPETVSLADGIHTFSVVREPGMSDERYLGYAGPASTGKIAIWRSSNRRNWRRTGTVPGGSDFRWPSAVTHNGEYILAVRERNNSVTRRIRRNLVRAIPGRHQRDRTHINLYRSTDGIGYTLVGTVLPEMEHGHVKNQNPFLFRDPVSGNLILYYYSGRPDQEEPVWQLRARTIGEGTNLQVRTDDSLLLESSRSLAAPGVFYHPGDEEYVLLAERKVDGEWEIVAFSSPAATGAFASMTTEPILDGDVACPFPFWEDDTLYLFTSTRQDGRWRGKLFIYGAGCAE